MACAASPTGPGNSSPTEARRPAKRGEQVRERGGSGGLVDPLEPFGGDLVADGLPYGCCRVADHVGRAALRHPRDQLGGGEGDHGGAGIVEHHRGGLELLGSRGGRGHGVAEGCGLGHADSMAHDRLRRLQVGRHTVTARAHGTGAVRG